MRQILNKIIFYLILLVFLLPFNPAFADPYTLFLATFVDSFPVEEQETFPQGLAFSSDGTKMFFTGAFGPDVNEYTLTTGFDVSTASLVGSFSVSAQGFVPYGLAFSSDGAKMFVVNDSGSNTGDNVNEYTLTNAFDVSTASFVDSFSVVEQENAPKGLAFSSDGTKMFVVSIHPRVYSYHRI